MLLKRLRPKLLATRRFTLALRSTAREAGRSIVKIKLKEKTREKTEGENYALQRLQLTRKEGEKESYEMQKLELILLLMTKRVRRKEISNYPSLPDFNKAKPKLVKYGVKCCTAVYFNNRQKITVYRIYQTITHF